MKKEFKVIRDHVGDKPYKVGQVRTVEEYDVTHLIGKSLEPLQKVNADGGEKSEKPLKNKSEPPLLNK